MKQLATRRALTWVLIFAACGGASTRTASPEAAEPDPGREFRLHYSNPGGMWLPLQMKLPLHVETLRKMGARIDAEALSDPFTGPLGAVVWIGGCTGSFVSPDGLILTAYHCVQDVLQVNTDRKTQRNILEDGFLARTRADELPAGAGHDALLAYAVTDVTARVRDGLDKLDDPVARALREEQNVMMLYQACKRRWAMRCSIQPYFGDALYLQTESFDLQDLRLVYAPARAVGVYGGEADNWKWPRHTGDWALLRAYVRRGDGAFQRYAASNVPFHPRSHLRVTTAGVTAGDFVMVAGFPGYTTRTASAASIHHWVETDLPLQIAWEKDSYAAAEQLAADPTDTGIKAILAKQTVQNQLAKDEATLAALTAGDAMARKDALHQRIMDWAAQPGREVYQQAIQGLDRLDTEDTLGRADIVRTTVFGSSQLLNTARYLLRWVEQHARSTTDRRLGFQDSYLRDALDAQLLFQWSYDRTLDRATFRRALVRASQLPAAERPWLATLLGAASDVPIDEMRIDRTLDDWYRAPPIEDENLRTAWIKTGTVAQLEASADPFVQAARRIWPLLQADQTRVDARHGQRLLLMPWYVDAMLHVLAGPLAPDANGSLRISYGTVKAMASAPDGPAASPFTVASQLLARDTGQEPFRAPRKLLAAIATRTYGPYADPALSGDLPINFLSDLDITGGNSGSPVLNRNGELVGLAFDSTGVRPGDGADDLGRHPLPDLDARPARRWRPADRGDGALAQAALTIGASRAAVSAPG
jgi:hypothetical protein